MKINKKIVTALFALVVMIPSIGLAQSTLTPGSENINDSAFRLTVCDGPALPKDVNPPSNLGHDYVPCNFNTLILQAQHLINIAIVLGVLVAIGGSIWAGLLLITSGGSMPKRKQALAIFQKIGIGFIIMLSAWAIVYQIIYWLTGNASFGALIGAK